MSVKSATPFREPVCGTSEWILSLVLSSNIIGAIPGPMGNPNIDWVHVDKLGDIIDVTVCVTPQNKVPGGFTVLCNILNPATTSWSI